MTRSQLVHQIVGKKTYLCVGLDTDLTKLPKQFQQTPESVVRFNKAIIDATKAHCVAYKINTAFYEALGAKGWDAMEETAHYIPETHLKIADAKRGDIGNTSAQYAKAFFETLSFDALTVAPYMGADSIKPFLDYADKWTIVLGLTSNSGAQDFELQQTGNGFLYEMVLQKVAQWGSPANLMFVIGATQETAFADIRAMLPHNFFLVPGVGAQGGSLKAISKHAMTPDCGLLVNASRAIIYASEGDDFAEEAKAIAKEYQYEMQEYLNAYTHETGL